MKPARNLYLVIWLFVFGAALFVRAEIQKASSTAQEQGTPLDVSAWTYRKPVFVTRAGVQQLQLDPEVLAHAQPDFADLRLMHESNQVPYILEHTTLEYRLIPQVTATNDAHNPKLSRWIIKLPLPNLPVKRLSCDANTLLFKREMTAYEELHDERGEVYQHLLGRALWTRTSTWSKKGVFVAFDSSPQSDTIILETENGDNPPIELENFESWYAVTRILFKAIPDGKHFLYYGNPNVNSPQYDLGLIANEVQAASKAEASLGVEKQLKKTWQSELEKAGRGGVVFWAVLALVVVALLVVIGRLLPKSGSTPPKAD